MLQYILECIAFQLLFLVVYDLFLKNETFFQKNRVYLIGSYVLSIILPGIKIAAFRTSLPDDFIAYPEYLWNMDGEGVQVLESTNSGLFSISWEYGVLSGGMFFASLLFAYKLYQIRRLKVEGEVHYFKTFTQVLIQKSSVAFSFFKTVFLGDQIKERDYENILKHELVHINQRHSYDLLFFEVMRIVCWFNPMVYLYQKRVAELHEFIADAEVAKTNKKEQYQLLLSRVFQTENISFINQFFTSSLIKKRIVMLQKQKSKKSYQLKYLLLVPLVVGMLFYTSCETTVEKENKSESTKLSSSMTEETISFAIVDEVPVFPGCENEKEPRVCFNKRMQKHISKNFRYPLEAQELGVQGRVSVMFRILKNGKISDLKMRGPHELLETEAKRIILKLPKMQAGMHNGENVDVYYSIPITFKLEFGKANMPKKENSTTDVPFAVIDSVPVFPGCENVKNKRACFNTMVQKHISKNFRYPLEAQEKGIQGRVSVMFTISKTGEIINIRKRGPNELLEEETVRIISKLPVMKPGVHKGKNVNVPFSIPITFKLK
ncbi:M56 family metallopeptidase [Maribacter sp.]|uniref:M56 family metallopeptidase n=1 Tax=Maribacter sp. TaxID=1897614 RepID=UPI0025B7A7A0|nr:M56 family metallopeptidase [Maribacter sp.]